MAYGAMDISGKVCVVTGGTSGIGKAIALGLASAGAQVVAASSSVQKVEAMAKELGTMHAGVMMDVADATAVARELHAVAERFGRIDALVHAAGVIKRQATLDMPVEEFERIVRVNLTGAFIVNQAVGRIMKEQPADAKGFRGVIVNIASLTSFVAFEGVCAYACSKAGVVALTQSLANDWAQYGIRVNAIAPGVVPTPLNRSLIEGTPRGAWLKAHTPMGRFGEAEELAGAAIYLVSPSASFVTGQTIVVDGGFLARGVGTA